MRGGVLTKGKLTALLCGLLMCIGLCGCDVHEFPGGEPDEPQKPRIEVVVSFKGLEWPELTTVHYETRSGVRAQEHLLRVRLNIYNDYTESRASTRVLHDTQTVYVSTTEDLSETVRHMTVNLSEGEYMAIVWADYVDALSPEEDLYYDSSDWSYISIKTGEEHPGNCHRREAFRGASRFTVGADGRVTDTRSSEVVSYVPVVAERPMARFEFITTDLEEFVTRLNLQEKNKEALGAESKEAPELPLTPSPSLNDYTVRIRYSSYMPSAYNSYIDKPVDSRTGVWFTGRMHKLSEREASLGFDHVFVNGVKTTVQVALEVYNSRTGEFIASTEPITVPLERNRHTYIKGPFLTTKANGNTGIVTDFYGEYNIFIR